jgi:hypothetical protein
MRFEVFTVVKIQVKVFWIMTPCSVLVGYSEGEGTMDLGNVGIIPQHYTVSQPRRTQPGGMIKFGSLQLNYKCSVTFI